MALTRLLIVLFIDEEVGGCDAVVPLESPENAKLVEKLQNVYLTLIGLMRA